MKRLAFAALAAILVSANAFAQVVVRDQQSVRGQMSGQIPSALYEPDSTGRLFRANQYGHLYVSDGLRDRDHWEFKGTGYQSDSLSALGWAKWGLLGGAGLSFVDLKDYTSATLMVSWAASADTDSVALEIFVIGKQSGSEDGYDYVYDTDDSDSLMTGFYVYSSDWGFRLWRHNSDRVSRRIYRSGVRSTQSSLSEYSNDATPTLVGTRTYQLAQLRGTGVMIPLTDIAGSDMLMPITGFWVVNRHPRRPLVGLNINLWAKVK